MFNIGLIELIIILFFALIIIKPEDLPAISKQIGLFYRKINSYIFNLKYEMSESDFFDQKNKSKKKIKKD